MAAPSTTANTPAGTSCQPNKRRPTHASAPTSSTRNSSSSYNPAPSASINRVDPPSCPSSPMRSGAGRPRRWTVAAETTTPASRASAADSSSIAPNSLGSTRPRRRSRATSQTPTPVRHARNRSGRLLVDRSIRAYEATVRERIAVGLRALRRDRMVYRRELAVHISWRRDTVGEIRVLGAREAIPVAVRGEQIPEDLASDAPDLAFDPANDQVRYARGDSGSARHPLAPGREADYRFASGDTTDITFPDGRSLRVYELRVVPRRADFRLMSGSLLSEGAGFGVVPPLFRPAGPVDMATDADTHDHVPGFRH